MDGVANALLISSWDRGGSDKGLVATRPYQSHWRMGDKVRELAALHGLQSSWRLQFRLWLLFCVQAAHPCTFFRHAEYLVPTMGTQASPSAS